MRLSHENVRRICAANGAVLADVLRDARVSRNAYDSLARKASVLARTVSAVADRLGVSTRELLDDDTPQAQAVRMLTRDVEQIVARHPRVDPGNVRHTLNLRSAEYLYCIGDSQQALESPQSARQP